MYFYLFLLKKAKLILLIFMWSSGLPGYLLGPDIKGGAYFLHI
jgi:hypothetical protein